MAGEFLLGTMEINMMVTTKIAKEMAGEFIFGTMEINMMASGKMTK